MISAGEFFARLADHQFANHFSSYLAGLPFEAAFWECPGYCALTANDPFECVLINTTALLGKPADPTSFRDQLSAIANGCSGAFPNIDGSATLIAPQRPQSAHCGHLLAFLRNASATEIGKLWAVVASQLVKHNSATPLWVSTSGLGVAWLHIRLDSQPKYYRYAPYKLLHNEITA